ncbi:hypothetical protein [Variovorax sp. 350MFTsu5.1]|uniref:hypothetical protein n=1 Tax=Variovorax sp. 350MFTsu5.1 TaxID=3158365 RepID=UPI003AAE090F
MTEKNFITDIRARLERQTDTLVAHRAHLKGVDLLNPVAANAAHEIRLAASALMVLAADLQSRQRIAAAEARTSLAVG